jgi:hypothetical protein
MSVKLRLGVGGVLLVVALVFIGLCLSQARAQEQDYPPGDDQIVPLALGGRAPFDGQLFSTDTAIRWGFRLQRLRLQLEEDVAREREICAAQNDLLTTKMGLAAENQQFQLTTLRDQLAGEHQTILDLTAQLAAAEEPPWYRTWTFGLIVGVVMTGALVAVSGYLIHEFA